MPLTRRAHKSEEMGHTTQDAPEDKAQGPPVSLPKEGGPGAALPGVSRTPVSAEPGQAYVQVHLGEE